MERALRAADINPDPATWTPDEAEDAARILDRLTYGNPASAEVL
jgi:hypothetical protein